MVTSSAQPPPGFHPTIAGSGASSLRTRRHFQCAFALPQNPLVAHGDRPLSIIFAEKRDLFSEAAYKRYTVPVGHRLE